MESYSIYDHGLPLYSPYRSRGSSMLLWVVVVCSFLLWSGSAVGISWTPSVALCGPKSFQHSAAEQTSWLIIPKNCSLPWLPCVWTWEADLGVRKEKWVREWLVILVTNSGTVRSWTLPTPVPQKRRIGVLGVVAQSAGSRWSRQLKCVLLGVLATSTLSC